MMRRIDFRNGAAVFSAMGLGLMVAGCASKPVPQPPMSAEHRAGLGRIAIVQRDWKREFAYDFPNTHVRRDTLASGVATGSAVTGAAGAMAGLGTLVAGAEVGAMMGGASGDLVSSEQMKPALAQAGGAGALVGGAVGLALAPPVAAVGAMHDAVFNDSGRKLRKAEPVVAQTLRSLDFEDALRAQLLQAIQSKTSCQATQALVASADAAYVRPTLENRYHDLRAQGFDTVIEISAGGSFEETPGWHNPYRVEADLWVTVIDLAHNREIFHDFARHRSQSKRFVEWANDDGKALKRELQLCQDRFTRRIMRRVFAAE